MSEGWEETLRPPRYPQFGLLPVSLGLTRVSYPCFELSMESYGDSRCLLPWGWMPPFSCLSHLLHQPSISPQTCRQTKSHAENLTPALVAWRQDHKKALKGSKKRRPAVMGKTGIRVLVLTSALVFSSTMKHVTACGLSCYSTPCAFPCQCLWADPVWCTDSKMTTNSCHLSLQRGCSSLLQHWVPMIPLPAQGPLLRLIWANPVPRHLQCLWCWGPQGSSMPHVEG